MSLDYEIYDLGDVALQRGATLRDCRLAFKTFGTLNAAKDNVIVLTDAQAVVMATAVLVEAFWHSGKWTDAEEFSALVTKAYAKMGENVQGDNTETDS